MLRLIFDDVDTNFHKLHVDACDIATINKQLSNHENSIWARMKTLSQLQACSWMSRIKKKTEFKTWSRSMRKCGLVR